MQLPTSREHERQAAAAYVAASAAVAAAQARGTLHDWFVRATLAHLLCCFQLSCSAHFRGCRGHRCSAGHGRLGAAPEPAAARVGGAVARRRLRLLGGRRCHGAHGGPHHRAAWQGVRGWVAVGHGHGLGC